MKSIGIVGQGFVGSAVKAGLENFFQIETFDLIKEKSTCKSIQELVDKTNTIFVCIPTPMNKDGSCYTGFVDKVLDELNQAAHFDGMGYVTLNIAIKSTIPPGTTELFNKKYNALNIVFNPEFLTEANAINDFKNQNRIIIGGPRPASTKFRQIYSKAFPKVKIIKTGSATAEMVKYLTNCFLAMKVSFANEMYQICDKLEVDYDKVVEYAQHDDRLGYSHWNVPGPDGDFGYGGHCFPKDVQALIQVAMSLNVDPRMLMSTHLKNEQVRKNRDWEGMEGRAVV